MWKIPSKIKRGIVKSLVYILMSAPILYNCTKDEFKDLEPFEPEIVISENVQILSGSELDNISEIDSLGNITFEEACNYSKGNILVAGISDKTPGGLLKKIENISCDGKTVNVINASLDEAIKKGEFSFSKNIELEEFEGLKGITYEKSSFSYSFNEVLIDLDGNLSTLEDQIKINGDISFDINTNVDAKFNWGDINFLFETEINEKSSLEAMANVNLIDFDKEVLVFSASGIPFQIPAPIPLIARPEFELYVGTKGRVDAQTKTKLDNDFYFEGGIYYENGDWSSKKDLSNEFIFYEPEVSIKGEIIAYCKPKLNLIINEVTGPSAGVKGYLEMEIDNTKNPWWELYGGLDFVLGISPGWLTKSFGYYEKTILEFKEKIADSGEMDNLEAKLIVSPEEGFAPLEVSFDASSSTGNIQEYFFEFGNGEEHLEQIGETDFDGKVNYNYKIPGNYNSNVTIKDISGKIDSKSLEVLVKKNVEIIELKSDDGSSEFSEWFSGNCIEKWWGEGYVFKKYFNCEDYNLKLKKIKFKVDSKNSSGKKIVIDFWDNNENNSPTHKYLGGFSMEQEELNLSEWTEKDLTQDNIKIEGGKLEVHISENLSDNCNSVDSIYGTKIAVDENSKGNSVMYSVRTAYDFYTYVNEREVEGELLIHVEAEIENP